VDSSTQEFKPPYIAFQTFWNFIESLGTNPLPPQIDRSMMSGKSGTDQNNLLLTLKSFSLIGESGDVSAGLDRLVSADEPSRKAQLAALVRLYYSAVLDVSAANGTEKQLNDSFRDAYGLDAPETRRKAITFFLHAARTGEIPLSAHFPKTRSGPGAPGTPRPRKASKKRLPTPADQGNNGGSTQHEAAATEYDTTVTLGNGGTVTLTVSVNPITLRGADRDFFFKIVDAFEAFTPTSPALASVGSNTDSNEV